MSTRIVELYPTQSLRPSPKQLIDAGIPYVILGLQLLFFLTCFLRSSIALGHSERRTIFHESSELVATKVRAAIDAGLKIILCIGETLQEREADKTAEVCEAQLKAVIDRLKVEDWRLVLHNISRL